MEVMVQTRAIGEKLNDVLRKLEKPDFDRILLQVGEVLGRVHSIQVEGVGRRHADGTWDFPIWEQMMTSEARNIGCTKEYIIQAGFSEREYNFMVEMLDKRRDEFPCHQPVLCHGDFEPDHILVDENLKVSGVIDFGQIQGGPPILDFMFFSLAQPELTLGPIRSGYPERELTEDRFDRQLNLYRLGFLMGCLAHITKMGNKDADKTPDVSGQLKKTLEALKHGL